MKNFIYLKLLLKYFTYFIEWINSYIISNSNQIFLKARHIYLFILLSHSSDEIDLLRLSKKVINNFSIFRVHYYPTGI